MKYPILILALLLAACGKDKTIVERSTEYVQVPAAVQSEIDKVVNQTNLDRIAQGLMPLAKGLTCALYDVSTTTPTTIPASPPNNKGSFVLVDSFNQTQTNTSNGLNILPTGLKNVYKQWYVVRCTGKLVVTDSGYESFKLTSDDGSMLYLDGALLINNDGLHGTATVSAAKSMLRGVHDIRVDYLQANGDESLILEDSSGVISGDKFYR